MDANVAARVGFVGSINDGVFTALRLDKQGGLVATNLQGMYTEQTLRGNKFSITNPVAGIDHGASLTTTPPLALWNPSGSGKSLAIMRIGMGYVSGTLGAGFISASINTSQPAAPTSGTGITPTNMNGGDTTGAVGKGYSGSTITAAASLIRSLFNVAPVLATSAVQFPGSCEAMLDGSIIVPPGAVFAVQGVCGAAGTTPKVVFFIEWDEVPLRG